ncbi:tubulin delta chain-like [Mya arenaria]|uniref:tubulin delta chain-like n=1 Tax=Mya arenaria TaxID=6604 RepID=UPI0022E32ED6|nr:tubulin delta chain-like [Mya arenaria]
MSVVTLQIGQCGNQVGGQLFSGLVEDVNTKLSQTNLGQRANSDYTDEVLERFFHCPEKPGQLPQARAVMVDMEPKAIAQTCLEAKKSGLWMYPPKQQFWQQRGSGNNWAHGFKVHGPAAEEKIFGMIQTEAEKCDNVSGFLTFMSLAGGTGSGVGAFITQCLKDEFPHAFLLNQVVWPYSLGEVIVQNYNAVLTLSHLYQSADAVLIMENDQLHKICTQLLNIKKLGFKDINKVICHKLLGVLLPAVTEKYPGINSSNSLGVMLEHLVPCPSYKLLTVKNIPQMSDTSKDFSVFQWQGLIKHLRQMLIANAAMEEGIDWQVKLEDSRRSLANTLILRGRDLDTVDTSSFSDPRLYPPWVPSDSRLSVYTQPRVFSSYEKCATLVSNNKSPIYSLNSVIDKAWNMFSSRAYTHLYVKHGLTEEDFVDSFVTLEQVVANYKSV